MNCDDPESNSRTLSHRAQPQYLPSVLQHRYTVPKTDNTQGQDDDDDDKMVSHIMSFLCVLDVMRGGVEDV